LQQIVSNLFGKFSQYQIGIGRLRAFRHHSYTDSRIAKGDLLDFGVLG
jgi:hypothetical protein